MCFQGSIPAQKLPPPDGQGSPCWKASVRVNWMAIRRKLAIIFIFEWFLQIGDKVDISTVTVQWSCNQIIWGGELVMQLNSPTNGAFNIILKNNQANKKNLRGRGIVYMIHLDISWCPCNISHWQLMSRGQNASYRQEPPTRVQKYKLAKDGQLVLLPWHFGLCSLIFPNSVCHRETEWLRNLLHITNLKIDLLFPYYQAFINPVHANDHVLPPGCRPNPSNLMYAPCHHKYQTDRKQLSLMVKVAFPKTIVSKFFKNTSYRLQKSLCSAFYAGPLRLTFFWWLLAYCWQSQQVDERNFITQIWVPHSLLPQLSRII